MKIAFSCCALCLVLAWQAPAQSTFSFQNKPVNAPVFDATGSPLAGTDYHVELYGNNLPTDLTPTLSWHTRQRVILTFLTGMNAGYFASGADMTVLNSPPGGSAWLQVRAWDARLGATYEDVLGLGIGGYGESPLFYANGGDPTTLETGAPLFGLESFSLRPIIPEPSVSALLAVGGVMLWMVRRRRGGFGRGNEL
jgi:hypothetical protein